MNPQQQQSAPWRQTRMEDINLQRMNRLVYAIGVQQEEHSAQQQQQQQHQRETEEWSPDTLLRQGMLPDGDSVLEMDLSFYAVERLDRRQITTIVDRIASLAPAFVVLNLRHNELAGDQEEEAEEFEDEDRNEEIMLAMERKREFLSVLAKAIAALPVETRESAFCIKHVILSHNKFSSLPSAEFMSLLGPQLLRFDLSHSLLENLPVTLSKLADLLRSSSTDNMAPLQLRVLDLSFNHLGAGVSPGATNINLLGPISHLREICLQGNGLTMECIENIVFGPAVEVVNMSQNEISGTLPEAMFGEITQLKELRLEDNKITALPSLLFEKVYHTLETLSVNSNCIEELHLPSSISKEGDSESNECALKEFDISNNKLETLPNNLFLIFNRIHTVYLHNNRLVGLPSQGLSELSDHITNITIHNNQIKELPEAILDLHQVDCLYWQQNKLKSLPGGESFGETMSHVKELDLSDNELETLPNSIGQMHRLNKLFLDSNKFHSLPNDLANLDLIIISIHGNPDLKLSPILQRTIQTRV